MECSRRKIVIGASAVALAGAAGIVFPARAQRIAYPELTGRWQRLDGGYVLEFRAIDAAGNIDALYFNPQPIPVAKAQVTPEGPILKIFVELRAPNYPGSTYTLTHDKQQDQLQGTYFQAVQRQNYAVSFFRMK